MNKYHPAPEWTVSQWFNTENSISLKQLRGKVVVVHAFQILCPGCVSHGIPQTQKIRDYFSPDDVAVIGLHTVFEHHQAMTPVSLGAFLHEYRVRFPVGVDAPSQEGSTPMTMTRYQMRGTPTLLLIDQEGLLRANYFGRVDDLQIGASISALLHSQEPNGSAPIEDSESSPECTESGCPAD